MKAMSRSASDSVLLLAVALCAAVSSARAGSIWPVNGAGERGMFADRKASRQGDILTVVVAESADATNTQNKKTTRDSALQDAVQQFIFSAAASKLGTHNGELPGTNITGKASYSGGGEVANSQSLNSRAAVLVSDVLPNGNLVIEGVRVVTFSGETQYVVLHGLVRPDDISSVNTVLSSNIADARVEFLAEGQLTDAQKRGWLTKLYEKLRPF
jgi:flagellar L-ring protein precursor FlgH